MNSFFDRLVVNIAFGVPAALVYLISFLIQGARYDYNPIYWPANKLFPVFAIALAVTAIYTQINFFRNAKKGLKIVKIIILVLLIISVPLLYLAMTKNNTAGTVGLTILVLGLLPVAFVFNVMTKGARATQLSLVASAVLALIVKTIVSSLPFFRNIGNTDTESKISLVITIVMIIAIPLIIGAIVFGIITAIKASKSKSYSSSGSYYSSNSYSSDYSSNYGSNSVSSWSSSNNSSSSVGSSSSYNDNSREIDGIKNEIDNSKGRQHDLENINMRDARKELKEWQDMLADCRNGNWSRHYVNLDQAEKECSRNINSAKSKIDKINDEIQYEINRQKELQAKLDRLSRS